MGRRKTLAAAVVATVGLTVAGATGIIRTPHPCNIGGEHALAACVTPAYGDVTAPTVSMTAPANAATVSGASTTVSATASDNVAVVGVQFKLDGANLGSEDTSSPFSITWDTTTTSDAVHTLTAVARDAASNTTTSSSISVTVSNGGATPVANEWVDSNGGTCSRQSTAGAYVDAAACSSVQLALAAAATGGDTIRAKCGSYGAQALTTTKTSNTIITSETPYCATFVSASSSNATFNTGSADWLDFKQLTVNEGAVCCAFLGSSSVVNLSDHVTIEDNKINVGLIAIGDSAIKYYAPQNMTIKNNVIGPSCCGLTTNTSPVPITIGKPSSATAQDCTGEACNVVISGNTFQYFLFRQGDWPISGWGAVPDSSCTNASTCHMDAIHIWGVIGLDITNNQFLGGDCQDIFLETTNNSLNKNVNIVGNTSTSIATQCNGFISLNMKGASATNWGGTINVGFNESPAAINIVIQNGALQPGTVINLYGNYTAFLHQIELAGGTSPISSDCAFSTGGGPDVNLSAVNYQYNDWRTGGPCDATDVTGTTTAWVNSSPAPAVGLDMHKTGSTGSADNFVPCASVTIGLGCPSTDYDGNAYAATADAGADQR